MGRWSDARGQATSEYVALVLLVAVVLTLAAGLTSGGVGGEVLAGLQRGLCQVAGTRCPRSKPPGPDLAPCPLERTTSRESLDGAFELARLGRSGTLTTERGSDGRVTVSLLDGATLGAEAGLGLHVSRGRRRGIEARADLAASIVSGRSWTLPNAAAARAFVARYGSKTTIGGKAVDLVRSGCSILCDAIGWRPHAKLPPPDDRYMTHGGLFGVKLPKLLEGSAEALIGARIRRDGTSAWFVQIGAKLGAVAAFGQDAVDASEQRQVVVSYSVDADGRPSRLVVHGTTWTGGRVTLRGSRRGLSGTLAGGGQLVTELDETLDLRDAQNRAVANAFVGALKRPWATGELKRRAAALHERIASNGVIDRRTYAATSSSFALGAKLAVGAQLGADFERTQEGMRLLDAETRLPGLPFLPRDDCRPA